MLSTRAGIFGSRAAVFAMAALVLGVFLVHSAPSVQAAGPTLTILSPADNAIIGNGTPVAIVYAVSDLNLTEPGAAGSPPDPNAGHVEVFVDGTWFGVTSDGSVVLPLASGTHFIRLRLVTDNGTGLAPEVSAALVVTSTQGPAGGSPTIAITFPKDGAQRGPDTAVSYNLTNFALVPPGGASTVPNEGHVEVFLDGALYQELTVYQPAHFSDVPDGDHTAILRLVDNAHHPLSPDVSDSVTFHVTASAIIDISPELAITNIILTGAIVVVLFYPVGRNKP